MTYFPTELTYLLKTYFHAEAADATDEEDESMELTAGEMDVTNQQLAGDTTQPQQGDTLPPTNQDDTLDGMLDDSQ